MTFDTTTRIVFEHMDFKGGAAPFSEVVSIITGAVSAPVISWLDEMPQCPDASISVPIDPTMANIGNGVAVFWMEMDTLVAKIHTNGGVPIDWIEEVADHLLDFAFSGQAAHVNGSDSVLFANEEEEVIFARAESPDDGHVMAFAGISLWPLPRLSADPFTVGPPVFPWRPA